MKVWLGWPGFALAISLALAGCGSNNSNTAVSISISPSFATVLLDTSLQFIPNVTGSSNAVQWSVNGIPNGNATFGTISSTGLYTAPVTRPILPTGAAVQIIFALANVSLPNTGTTGAVIELKAGSDFTNFSAGNTINISGNSVAGWNGSFIITAVGTLADGNFGVQIGTPAGPPANGVGGIATATPNLLISAQVEGTSSAATAILTLDSGIRVSISPTLFTLGTGETFQFLATVTGTGGQLPSGPSVTWSASAGSIDANGNYTAADSPGTVTITATSVVDISRSASATITVITAVDPTVTSITPATGALGAVSEDIYLSGSNFISTTRVFLDGNQAAQSAVVPTALSPSSSTSTILRVRLSGDALATPDTGVANVVHTITVASQKGGQSDPTQCQCQLTLSAVRPAAVSASPDSVVQNSSSQTFHIHGGYFGTFPNPDVNVSGCWSASSCGVPDGSVSVATSGRDFELPVTTTTPGLVPVTVASKTAGLPPAVVNLAIQPSPVSVASPVSRSVGTLPVAVAIDTATGIAAVANQGSNDITLIDVNSKTVLTPSVSVGAGPTSVAVDNLRHVALVGNGDSTLSVVDMTAQTVLFTVPLSAVPAAVGVNPVTGTGIVAFKGAGFASILDLTPLDAASRKAPVISGVVQISTGPNAHVAVSPRLNWALVSPGGAGTLSIVDLARQTLAAISSVTRNSSGTVTVTTTSTNPLQAGQPVVISGVNNSSFNGLFSVVSASNTSFTYAQSSSLGAGSGSGGTAASSLPVATVATNPNVSGVAINDETEKAILVDPSGGVPGFIFNIFDQTSTLVGGLGGGNAAAAFNPFDNIVVTIGRTATQASVINPVTPSVLTSFADGPSPVDIAIDPATNTAVIVNQGNQTVSLFSLGSAPASPQILQISPTQVTINSTLTSGAVAPNATQTVTIVGAFSSSAIPRLDGDPALIQKVSVAPGSCSACRVMTATIDGTVLAAKGPRRYALDVKDGVSLSNAEGFAVIQSVSLNTGNCSSPAPQAVAVDVVHNVAVVTEPGTSSAPCNQVSLINLQNGMGTEQAVGTNPQGVAVYPPSGLAVVANAGSSSVSIVDITGNNPPVTFGVDPIPTGVAIDLGTGNAVVTANGASLIDVFPVSASSQTPTTIGVLQGPTGVAIDPTSHLAVVANSASNSASLVDLIAHNTTHTTNSIFFPQGVAFDPLSNNFLITSGAANQVVVLDPLSGSVAPIRVGINPSSIAYNFASGTLVTANNLSGTMTVVDFVDQTVRGIFSLRSSTQFAVDIHPQTNLAVVADTVGNQLLLVPLPH